MKFNKKGAEESNVIIFIILALVVVGLIIWFSYSFFSKGTNLIDGNDPSVTVAIESCKAEMKLQDSAYCNSAKSIKIKGGNEMIVSCHYLNSEVRRGSIKESYTSSSCSNRDFVNAQCGLIEKSGVLEKDLKKVYVNGVRCTPSPNLELDRAISNLESEIGMLDTKIEILEANSNLNEEDRKLLDDYKKSREDKQKELDTLKGRKSK